jgi:hypothetical protein
VDVIAGVQYDLQIGGYGMIVEIPIPTLVALVGPAGVESQPLRDGTSHATRSFQVTPAVR